LLEIIFYKDITAMNKMAFMFFIDISLRYILINFRKPNLYRSETSNFCQLDLIERKRVI